MRGLATVGLVAVAACGCAQHSAEPETTAAKPESAVSSADTPKADQSAPPSAFPLPEFETPAFDAFERPSTVEDFKTLFVQQFQTDIYSPFIQLGYWGASSQEQKKKYLEGVQRTFTMPGDDRRATIDSPSDVTIKTLAEYGSYPYFPSEGDASLQLIPHPSHVLGINAHIGKTIRVTNYFAVGERDGKFYFSMIADK